MSMGKPDLNIIIPGATAPELPYSQRPQAAGADPSRLQKVRRRHPTELSCGTDLHSSRCLACHDSTVRSCLVAYCCCGKHGFLGRAAVLCLPSLRLYHFVTMLR
jgi:hypothetical protein